MLPAKNTATNASGYAPILQHVAFIMDGNGRWAKKNKLSNIKGHRKGVEVAREIIKYAIKKQISYVTLYTFSTENWKRNEQWISDFMGLMRWYLRSEIKELMNYGIKLQFIGDLSRFSKDLQDLMENAEKRTVLNNRITVTLALNYGGRDEITRMVKKLAYQVQNKTLLIEDINTQIISQSLDTQDIPDPDLLIRTSGEQRISNYLLWQLAYTEFIFNDKLWPDYTVEDFEEALNFYGSRQRRYGG